MTLAGNLPAFCLGDLMLKIIRSLKELNIAQLMAVYIQSNIENGACDYPQLPSNMQLLQAEQDFYAYLKLFFNDNDALCAVWETQGAYKAILRLERHCDGLLLAGLETAPEARGQGYAKALVNAVIEYLCKQGKFKLYSHVDKNNKASLAVHRACGFTRILAHAVYADGSVLHSACTFCRLI